MREGQRFFIIPRPVGEPSDASTIGVKVWFRSKRAAADGEKLCRGRRWVPIPAIPTLAREYEQERRQALRKAIVDAARSVGLTTAAEAYLGVPVAAFRGRRPGSPSRRKEPVIEGAERVRIARDVHEALGKPQIYEALEHGALKKAVAEVAKARNLPDKIIDTCYRAVRNNLQSEMADVDWDQWIKGYRAHAFAQVRSEKPAITRAEALKFWRAKLINNINVLVN
ncbi:hypothetical protein [Mesorhizobium sp.]|uniref:hypothetical protein n=1 Tax=Mesorhizobium sp. TaxID=1871066 RepID=UPI001219AF94|nr:hypothetical protein [Mesorhizobium sp.]TIT00211.1 MAG: hypothetical protein E5W87_19725 [Mesorhizobium sp.]